MEKHRQIPNHFFSRKSINFIQYFVLLTPWHAPISAQELLQNTGFEPIYEPISNTCNDINGDVVLVWASDVERCYFYSWDNGEPVTLTEFPAYTNPTPAGIAHQQITDWLVDAAMTELTISPQGIWAIKLTQTAGNDAWIMWSPFENASFTIPSSWSIIETIDLQGAINTSVPTTISLDAEPMLLRSSNTVLPITMSNPLTARQEGDKVLLRWATATESNNKGFDVQHSSNGYDWTPLGWIDAAGHANSYTAYDDNPLAGKNYYCFMQIDYDGNSEFSNIVSTIFGTQTNRIATSPNPVVNQLRYTSNPSMTIQYLTIQTLTGKTVLYQKNPDTVLNVSLLPRGIYFVNFHGKNYLITQKFVN